MIDFDGVSFAYQGASRPTLRDVSLTVPDGDFCLLIGATGAGKSTLLRAVNGLVPHTCGGTMSGRVRVAGREVASLRPRDLADVVGFVGQDPAASFVTDTVTDEIAYGMEQLGLSPVAMRKRVEETLDLMGIAELRDRPLVELSGGQQQRVAIAAVLAAQPRVLVLDEPTSSLDPTAAHDVLAALVTLVHDVGLTVLLAEHRLERVMQAADSIIWLPGDGSAVHGPAGEVLRVASITPPLAALARVLGWDDVPLSVRDARRRVQSEGVALQRTLSSNASVIGERSPTTEAFGEEGDGDGTDGDLVVHAEGLSVAYGTVRAVRGVDLDLTAGSVTAIMGRNGAGKSSLLWALQGSQASTGVLSIDGRDPRPLSPTQARALACLVPQTATDLLYLPSVARELAQADAESHAPPGTARAVLDRLGLELDPDADPRDLSEGQRLGLVLAIQLAARPRVVLLDEPTRGLDYTAKEHLRQVIADLAEAGLAVAVSTHDVEFAAAVSTRMVLMAAGEIIADGPTREVATASPAYAPQLAKVFAPTPVLTPAELAAWLGVDR